LLVTDLGYKKLAIFTIRHLADCEALNLHFCQTRVTSWCFSRSSLLTIVNTSFIVFVGLVCVSNVLIILKGRKKYFEILPALALLAL
jgi:hypothetical protein